MRLLPIAACLSLAVAVCAGAQPAAADEVSSAIDRNNAAYVAGLERGSAAELAALYTDDGTQLPSNAAPVYGREAIRASYERTFKSMRIVSGSLVTMDIKRHGDIAYETGQYSFDFANDGKYAHSTGRYLTIWRRVAGVWKMDLNLGQQDAPAR